MEEIRATYRGFLSTEKTASLWEVSEKIILS